MGNIRYGKITAQDAMGALNRCERYAYFVGSTYVWHYRFFITFDKEAILYIDMRIGRCST